MQVIKRVGGGGVLKIYDFKICTYESLKNEENNEN